METTIKKLPSYPAKTAGERVPADGFTPTGERAFEELYRLYFVRLFRFCHSIVHQKESAEEIVNDVFLKLWEKRDNTPPIANPRLYLYVSVKNRSLNHLRNNSNLPTIEISERCDSYIRFDTNPESLLLGAETLQRIRAAINQLPPRCKLIFSLIKEDGLKYKDVARLLDLSVKTVEAQLVIALRKIAASLGK
jgi:RNA polymerase sigma-70 factor (family 1)